MSKKSLDEIGDQLGERVICPHCGDHFQDKDIHRRSNLFDKRFFPVKYWIVIAYAVSCCLLPKQTPYDL